MIVHMIDIPNEETSQPYGTGNQPDRTGNITNNKKSLTPSRTFALLVSQKRQKEDAKGKCTDTNHEQCWLGLEPIVSYSTDLVRLCKSAIRGFRALAPVSQYLTDCGPLSSLGFRAGPPAMNQLLVIHWGAN
jgi:hypothetical protein